MPPINPITVPRLKTFGLLGHSNADGWAPLVVTAATHNQLHTKAGSNPVSNPALAYFQNCYAITAPQPYPEGSGTPVGSVLSDSDILELTVANTLTPAEPHPHGSPFLYPNNRGSCYPNWYYEYYPNENIDMSPGRNHDSGHSVLHGVELPLMQLWRAFWGEQVCMNKVAFSSSFLLPAESGIDPAVWLNLAGLASGSDWDIDTANYDYHAWWTPRDRFDFAPSTDRLYKSWYDKSVAAQTRLDEAGNGVKLDYRLIVLWLGDNDSVARTSTMLQESMGETMKALIKRIRKDIRANDWSSVDANEVAFVIMGVSPLYQNSLSPEVNTPIVINTQYREIADNDEFVTFVPTSDFTLLSQEGIAPGGIEDTTHFGPEGYMAAASDIFLAFQEMVTDPWDSLDIDEAKTVSEAKDAVRLYYTKSRSNTELQDDLLLQHLNGAMFHVFNHVGDNAWWLRRRGVLSIDGGPTRITTLPRYVKRLLMIEDASDPDYPIEFRQIGHGDNGRLQINMRERSTGTFTCQFICNPRELSKDDQIVPAPRQVFEWIIVEACRRLAASSSNAPLSAHFAGEARQLMEDCMRNAGQTQRSKKDVMRTQRRRPRLGYSKGPGRFWWGRGR